MRWREYEAMEAGEEEEESRCSSESVTMLHEEVILTNTPWRPGAGGSHQRCSFSRQPPPTHTHKRPNTHTHTPSYHHSDSAFTHPRPTTVVSPACHSCSHSPPLSPRRSCVTWGSAASSGEAKSLGALPPCIAPRGVTGPAVCRTRKEITTDLLLLSARVSDEQKRPLADANCRGVEGGVWGGGERKNVKREKKGERECWEGSGGWW